MVAASQLPTLVPVERIRKESLDLVYHAWVGEVPSGRVQLVIMLVLVLRCRAAPPPAPQGSAPFFARRGHLSGGLEAAEKPICSTLRLVPR